MEDNRAFRTLPETTDSVCGMEVDPFPAPAKIPENRLRTYWMISLKRRYIGGDFKQIPWKKS